MRRLAVREIKRHQEQYQYHLELFATELVEGDLPLATKVGAYLDNLETPGYWGGEECLSAIANIFKVQIEVYQSDGKIVVMPDAEPGSLPVYRIFYRGNPAARNHYDSILFIRPTNLPQYPSDYMAICSDSRTIYVHNPGQEEATQIPSLLRQITGSVPTNVEINILRWLVAEDIEERPPTYLTSCGVPELEQNNYTLRMRFGYIDGGPVTYISLAALLKVRIFSHDLDGDALRYDPAQGGHLAVAHVIEDTRTIPSRYLSVICVKKPDSLRPDPYDVAQTVHQDETHVSPEPIADEVTIEANRGLRFATLNVNGCRLSDKRKAIDTYLHSNRIHVAALQEVNLNCARTSTEHYHWHLSKTQVNRRRGLAVLVRKGAKINISTHSGGGPNIQLFEITYEVNKN